jgi:hypothetical protein
MMILMLSAVATAVNDKLSEKEKDDIGRMDFIHHAKPSGIGKPGTSDCYDLMGVKWTALPVTYAINPINPDGLSEESVVNSISSAAENWDNATSTELFNDIYSIDHTAEYGLRDQKNSVVFGPYTDGGAIAVTSIWYSKKTKQILEFDMIFNTKFTWGDASIDATKMDLLNIATHEFGHSVGLSDIYSTTCSAVTMYGYSNYGDMSKITLEQPDVTGLQTMYGQ